MFINNSLEKNGVLDEKADMKIITNDIKKVIFIGMHHFGQKEFYQDVAHKIDSLQKSGYIVFYEKIKKDSSMDSLTNDIYLRKIRKITELKSFKYYDTISKKILGKYQYKGDYKLINQPKYSDLIVNIENAINADVKANTLVDVFEVKYGAIVLSECDKNTSFTSKKYKCDLIDKGLRYRFRSEFILDYRNQNIANEVVNSENENILIIYGKNHLEGLISELQKIDSRWK